MSEKKDGKKTNEITRTAFLEYASHLGSAVIRPEDRGKIKGNSLKSMYQQTDNQFLQLKEQFDLLVRQAKDLKNRILISEEIYKTKLHFTPVINQSYYLYRKPDQNTMLSMISPQEWGDSFDGTYIAKVRLLADHTWEVVDGEI